jgi:N6-L-threonylcarbamoyladenine synthase
MLILGIESSCDETAAAVVGVGRRVLSSVVASQVELHARFGGIHPEVASRAHAECVSRIIEQALATARIPRPSALSLEPLALSPLPPNAESPRPKAEALPSRLEAIAVTVRPGLAGSLLVGTSAAAALALAWELPLVQVHHLAAHAYAPHMAGLAEYPYACLVASGGHTTIYECRSPLDLVALGGTIDDAAGEAFDKVAAILGLGFPGGPAVSRAAATGNPRAFAFPRSRLAEPGCDFSFSGLKTAVLYAVKGPGCKGPERELTERTQADLAASFEQAACEVLVGKLVRAAQERDLGTVAVSGGVAANRRLRRMLEESAAAAGLKSAVAPPDLCTDNAAMVAGLGFHQLQAGQGRGPDRLELAVVPRLERPGRGGAKTEDRRLKAEG